MDVQLKRGYIEICVLAAMLREDTYGYKLIKDVSPYIDISESTLYPILKRLESSGCVRTYSKEYNGRLRKYYRISPVGKDKIKEFMEDWEEILRMYRFIKEEYVHDKSGISSELEQSAE